ncbi:hypothetical protein ABZP36_028184 [Zizania latifolia]
MEEEAAALWGHKHLPLLARAQSKDSLEYILQALWRTRRTGLDAADRAVVRDILQLPSDADLDPVCTLSPPHPSPSPPLLSFPGFPAPRSLVMILSPAAAGMPQGVRVLIRRCVHENIGKDEVPKLFPDEVSLELQRLLTLLLQKFQSQWQEDNAKDQASMSRSATAEHHSNENQGTAEQPAAGDTGTELQNDIKSSCFEKS